MPRHMQPREVAEMKGATRKHPERYRTILPDAPLELGNAPDHLSEAAKAAWFEIATYAPVAVLRGADRLLVETTAQLVAEMREDWKEFKGNKIGTLVSCLGRLGMTPSDRNKLGMEKPPEDNPFAED